MVIKLDRSVTDPNGGPVIDTSAVTDHSKMNLKEKKNHAERTVIALVEERQKIQDLILEACMKLKKYGFECDAGPLSSCDEFIQIQAFAKGVPHITRPPLVQMPLDGMRSVKKIHQVEGKDLVDVYLECGHAVVMTKILMIDQGVKMNVPFACTACIELLKERDMYENATTHVQLGLIVGGRKKDD